MIQYNSPVVFIAQLMGYSWGALAGCFLAPFLYGLYMKRASKLATWICFAWGVGLTVVNMTMGLVFDAALIASPINCGAICMVASLVFYPILCYILPKDLNDEHVESCFAGYGQKVLVPATAALGAEVEEQIAAQEASAQA